MVVDVNSSTSSLTNATDNIIFFSTTESILEPDSVADVSTRKYVSFAVTLLFFVLGLFGNSCTIAIMIKQKDTYNVHGIYITALAAADILSLLVVTINKRLIYELFGVDLRAFTEVGCKLFKYIGRVIVICSSHFVVLICIERFIAVLYPLKAKFLLSKKNACISICAIFVALLLVNFPCMIYTGVRNGVCLPDFAIEPNHPLPRALSIMTWLLHTAIPSVILICLTPVTILQLYRHNSLRRRMGVELKYDATSRITVMLISIVISYFLLICVFSILFWTLIITGTKILTSNSQWSKIFSDVYETAELINYSFNFFLYGVTSADFRHQICHMFGWTQKSSQSLTDVTPETTTNECKKKGNRHD